MKMVKFEFKSWGSFSYVDGHLKENGVKADLPMISHYKCKAGSTIIYDENYLLTPMLRWISGARRNAPDFDDSTSRSKVPAYFVMDMHAEIKVSYNLSIKADIYNLLDKQYGHAPFPSAFPSLDTAPQPGRLATATLYSKF